MFLESIHLKNFCQHEDLFIQFKPGITGILGRNGKGKSNLIAGLRFVNSGTSGNHGVEADNLRDGAESGYVDQVFSQNEIRHRLKRHIETGKVRLEFGDTKLTKVGEVTKHLESLWNTPMAAVVQHCIPRQREIEDILLAGNQDRLKDFQRVFGLELAEQSYDLLGVAISSINATPGLEDQLTQLTAALLDQKTRLAAIDEELAVHQRTVADTAGALAILERAQQAQSADLARKHLMQARSDAQLANMAAITDHQEKVATHKHLSEQVANFETKVQEVRQLLEGLQKQKARYEAGELARQTIKDATAALQTLMAANPSISDPGWVPALYQHGQQLDNERTFLSAANANKQWVNEEIVALQGQEQQAKLHQARVAADTPQSAEEVQARADLAEQKKHQGSFADGKCPTCGQAVNGGPEEAAKRTAEIARLGQLVSQLEGKRKSADQQARAQVTSLITDINLEIVNRQKAIEAANKARIAELDTLLQAASKNHAAAVKLVSDASVLLTRIDAAKEQAAYAGEPVDPTTLKPLQDVIDGYNQMVSAVSAAAEAIKWAAQQLPTLGAKATAAEQAVVQHDATVASVDCPKPEEITAAKLASEQHAAAKTVLAQKQPEQAQLQLAVNTRTVEVKRLQDQIVQQALEAKWYGELKAARDVLHRQALPLRVMREYAQVLNERVRAYLDMWEADFDVWLDPETMLFRARAHATGTEKPAQRLSGGQLMKAAISFRIALADMFAREFGLIVLDEPTVFLDADSISHFQKMLLQLKAWAGNTGRQIIIVTHQESLLGYFDNLIEI